MNSSNPFVPPEPQSAHDTPVLYTPMALTLHTVFFTPVVGLILAGINEMRATPDGVHASRVAAGFGILFLWFLGILFLPKDLGVAPTFAVAGLLYWRGGKVWADFPSARAASLIGPIVTGVLILGVMALLPTMVWILFGEEFPKPAWMTH